MLFILQVFIFCGALFVSNVERRTLVSGGGLKNLSHRPQGRSARRAVLSRDNKLRKNFHGLPRPETVFRTATLHRSMASGGKIVVPRSRASLRRRAHTRVRASRPERQTASNDPTTDLRRYLVRVTVTLALPRLLR
jgi:hypothetical protein